MKLTDSAFPWYNPGNEIDAYYEQGLTIRQYFAARAMEGIISNGGVNPENVAKSAVKYADALIKELSK